jgi:hypothetical protein
VVKLEVSGLLRWPRSSGRERNNHVRLLRLFCFVFSSLSLPLPFFFFTPALARYYTPLNLDLLLHMMTIIFPDNKVPSSLMKEKNLVVFRWNIQLAKFQLFAFHYLTLPNHHIVVIAPLLTSLLRFPPFPSILIKSSFISAYLCLLG